MAPPFTFTLAGSRLRKLDHCERLGGEGFVQFNQINIIQS